MRPAWKILIVVGVVGTLIFVALAIPHYRAKAALRAYCEQLQRQGEKMNIAELSPSLSAEEVARGRELLSASGFFRNFVNSPTPMRWMSPGHALVSWAETISPTEKTNDCWPQFGGFIKAHTKANEEIYTVLQGANPGFSLDYEQGYSTPLPHLSQLKAISVWLAGATVWELHDHNRSNAWGDLETEMDLIQKVKGEPLMISQLVRMAEIQIAISATWEALQYGGWSDEQLGQLQTNWDAVDVFNQFKPSMAMGREMARMMMTDMRNSYSNYDNLADNAKNYDSLGEALNSPRQGIPAYIGRHPRYWIWKWCGSYHEEMYIIQYMQIASEAMQDARTNDAYGPAMEQFQQAVTNLQKNYSGWGKRFVLFQHDEQFFKDYLLKTAVSETARRMTVTAVALERYRLRHGKYPKQLQELVPDYLPKTPIDFMDGKPLRYRRKEDDTFLFYSVGADGKDDGGDGSPMENNISYFKAWFKMRDMIWPSPATTNEVQQYEADLLKKMGFRSPGKLVPQIAIPAPVATNTATK